MARNDERRAALADAALRVLAREGTRGLTHRAVDAEAGVPTGTASNYFRNRPALIAAVADRITVRLSPEQATLDELSARPPSRELFAAYLRDIVRRLTLHRDLALALFELRLEAGRRAEIAEVIGRWLRAGFEADVAFNEQAGLPGGRAEIALFHYALDGLLLDRLTTSIDPDTSTDDVMQALVDGLLPDAPAAGTRPRVEAYVVRDGSVLVFTHRPTTGSEGSGLQIPGGTLHDGEEPADAVVREVHEETGLAVEVVAPLGTATRDGRELHRFHVRPIGPVPQAWDHDEKGDGDAVRWTFNLFWLPIPVARHALDFGMGEPLDRLA
ncbi:transcriptional regulator, TetR family [Pseudonocardia thermophila]|uniref:Transcriptional regulator, TetR family n=1 Tax=Pseudonocardia thermophila TaxID=1848 RepID=A0A1M6YU34_PSETH|nr:NUDIX domain-containing protein [Pseudonocardia thermophila]SHL21603.1 transcriptional regulator, TetR family [Pseudonocardia thermophila]